MKCRSIAIGALAAIAWAAAQTPSAPAMPRTQAMAADPMQDLAASALITGLRGRFEGRDVELRRVRVQRQGGAGDGEQLEASAMFRLADGQAWMPVHLSAYVDAASGALEPVGIDLGTGSARVAPDPGPGASPGARAPDTTALDTAVEARLAAEFPGQQVGFDLGSARPVVGDGRYQLVRGTGVARFGADGNAEVRIDAVYDAQAHAWLGVGYQLGGPV